MQRTLYFALLATLVLGAFNRIPITSSIAINLSDIIATLLLIYTLFKSNPFSDKFLKNYTIWVSAIFLVFAASLIPHVLNTPPNELIVAILYPIRFYIYFLLPISLIPLFQKQKHPNQIPKHIEFTFLIISLFGLTQFILIPNLKFLENFGYDPHYYRLVSTWLDPNFLGAALVFALLISYNKILNPQNLQNPRLIRILPLIIIFIALILTFSRSAYIMFIIAFALYSILMRSIKTFALLVIAIILISSIYFFSRASIDTSRNIDRNFSANLRLMSYGLSTEIFLDNPLTGSGYNLIRYEKRQRGKILDVFDGGNSGAGIDSSWLLILATTGILGTLAFISFWTRVAYFSLDQQSKKSKPFQTLIAFLKNPSPSQSVLISLFLAWSIHAWFINSLFYIPIIVLWTITFSSHLTKKIQYNFTIIPTDCRSTSKQSLQTYSQHHP